MSNNKTPPNCYICEKETDVDKLYYCICDIAVCNNCINSVKKNENTWICPKCSNENDASKSMLFRTT